MAVGRVLARRRAASQSERPRLPSLLLAARRRAVALAPPLGSGPLLYSCSLYWILRGETPRMLAAFDVEPPHASSVFRIA